MDSVFPDTAEGIPRALARGVTLLWANTVLFSGYPLDIKPVRGRGSQGVGRLTKMGLPVCVWLTAPSVAHATPSHLHDLEHPHP
ncbi:hypothetical protein [Ralstonia insidiosa]|uniref:Uncharacterized protein n=1 Tax=Ralstonia insidiosa TaxID=190721 RepID=A0A848P8B5_9RALS|nr:hypothetical protein [Ralstonia insidiosa]NMV41423.1 hypothetical protein [Ralstonia insidiosa]